MIRVLIVEDHPVVRLGLRSMIESAPGMVVVGEASTGHDGLRAFTLDRPDVTLMDLRLPGMGGLETIAAIRRREPEARIIVMSGFGSEEDVFRAVTAGARGFLLKGTPLEQVIDTISRVHAGQRLLAPDLAISLADRLAEQSLTAREVGVLQHVAQGMSNKDIAARLSIVEDTVKNHMKSIFKKMRASSRTDAALMAVRKGIVKLRGDDASLLAQLRHDGPKK
jgi:DNA-binding NarL/FixJ family response regulator